MSLCSAKTHISFLTLPGNLAEKSAEAAQRTHALISNTTAAVAKGSGLVAEVAKDMDAASDSALKVAEINSKISTAAKDAANSVPLNQKAISYRISDMILPYSIYCNCSFSFPCK